MPALDGKSLLVVIAVGLASIGCSDDSGSREATNADVVERLVCDRLSRFSDYEPNVFSGEVERARDCYRDGEFAARIHRFRSRSAAAHGLRVFTDARYRFPPQELLAASRCPAEPSVLKGSTWIVVTAKRLEAKDARERVGGRLLPRSAPHTPVVSYLLPCDETAS